MPFDDKAPFTMTKTPTAEIAIANRVTLESCSFTINRANIPAANGASEITNIALATDVWVSAITTKIEVPTRQRLHSKPMQLILRDAESLESPRRNQIKRSTVGTSPTDR